jgi:hypothetical protein
MAAKERFQNPVVGDTLTLRLFSYNGNAATDFTSVSQVQIYYLDDNQRTAENPDGRALVATIPSGSISHDDTGQYSIQIVVEDLNYVLGQYLDIWTVLPQSDDVEVPITNTFQIYPNLWFTNTIPIIYDFEFVCRPNKIRQGSKRYLIVEITPNVPNTSDLARYYENLAIVSPVTISIAQACGNCVPQEADLKLIVDNDPVELREKTNGYYFLDTTLYDCGIYDVWFTLIMAGNTYISDKQQIQIF